MHNNMFSDGHERAEVKTALIQHLKRDSRVVRTLDVITGLCLAFELRHQSGLDSAGIFIGVFAALSALRHFIDQSNRNFFLHRLDWDETADLKR